MRSAPSLLGERRSSGAIGPGAIGLGKTQREARLRSRHEIVLIAGAGNRSHRGGVEQAVLEKAIVNVNADHLTEGDETRARPAVEIGELQDVQQPTLQRAG